MTGSTLEAMPADLLVCHLGLLEYRAAAALQEHLRERVAAGELGELLLLLEHPPVYTRGRRSQPGELPMGELWYAAQGIDTVETDRGGKVTYHGPGQLVGYPIMHVDSVLEHVRIAERAIIAALAEEGISARSRDEEGADYIGVWAGERKIASVGVRVTRGVSKHGFAVNVDLDLQPFEWIVPCGLDGVRMTSIARERRDVVGGKCFRRRVAHAFCREHGRRQRLVTPGAARHRRVRALGGGGGAGADLGAGVLTDG